MKNEQELDQKAIDELLATANKELAGLGTPPPEMTALKESSAEKSITPLQTPKIALPIKNSPKLLMTTLKQHLTKKILVVILTLFVLVSGLGAYLGYKMADHTMTSQTPLEKIIQQGITFEAKNFVTYAGRGDKEIVNAFLDAGMSVNVVRITDGWSPLMSASFYKKSDIVQLLLDHNATINLQDKYGKTALIQATVMGAEDIVTMLLEYGANPNLQDNNGRTALLESYSKQYAKISEILKNAGAILTIEPPQAIKNSPEPPLYPSREIPIETFPTNLGQENRLSVSKAGFIQIGMPLADIQKKYPSLTVVEKYVDGSKKTIAKLFFNGQKSPSLEVELSSGTLKLVSTISIYDEQFSTDKQITIKSTVGDIRNQYTINDVKVIDNSLFLVVKSIKMLFELDLSKGFIPTEWLNTGNPNSIPADTKIKRIVIY